MSEDDRNGHPTSRQITRGTTVEASPTETRWRLLTRRPRAAQRELLRFFRRGDFAATIIVGIGQCQFEEWSLGGARGDRRLEGGGGRSLPRRILQRCSLRHRPREKSARESVDSHRSRGHERERRLAGIAPGAMPAIPADRPGFPQGEDGGARASVFLRRADAAAQHDCAAEVGQVVSWMRKARNGVAARFVRIVSSPPLLATKLWPAGHRLSRRER